MDQCSLSRRDTLVLLMRMCLLIMSYFVNSFPLVMHHRDSTTPVLDS